MDPDGWAWTEDVELLAEVLEAEDRTLALLEAANSKSGKVRKGLEVPRPWKKRKEGTTLNQLMRLGGEIVIDGKAG